MIILILLMFFIILVVCVVINFSFKQVVLAKRKTKENALALLKERDSFDIDRVYEIDSKLEELELISDDNLKLKGYYLENNIESKSLVIIVHGYTANHYLGYQFIDLYKDEGFNILLIDERGHGNSEGKYATYGIREKEDIKLWIDLMKNKLGTIDIIGLHGQSMGAATSLMYGGKFNDVDFIVADCPYSDGKSILEYQFKEIGKLPPKPIYFVVDKILKRKCGFCMQEVSPKKDIKNCDIPILFIHGKADKTIPYSMSEEMFKYRDNNKDKLLLVEGADHVLSYAKDKENYRKAVVEHIDKLKVR